MSAGLGLNARFDLLDLGEKLTDEIAINFVHAVPHAIEDKDILREKGEQLGEGVGAALKFVLVIAVGLKTGERDEVARREMSERSKIERAQSETEFTAFEEFAA